MSLAWIPLYLQLLGNESFALVGLFALLQAWLIVFNLVLQQSMSGMVSLDNTLAIRSRLLKLSLSIMFSGVIVALGIWAASGWLASTWVNTEWLNVKYLPVESVGQAFTLMGVVTVLQLIESLYSGTLVGLQRQSLQNVMTSLLATLRGLGAVGVLVWFSPTVNAFFIWQGLISLVIVLFFAGLVYQCLRSTHPGISLDRASLTSRVGLMLGFPGFIWRKQGTYASTLTARNPSLKKNVAANYLGQGWRALMSMAFIPLYIRYLGIESYGLIGIFAILQAWLGLLDMGMRPALGREMARFTGGAHDAQTIRNLLRSIEVIAFAIAVAVALGIWAASGWLASNWLNVKNLPVDIVVKAFSLMGVVTALQFIESIYASSIAGLQRQVLQNVITSTMATARGLGAVGILVWVSPTIEAFFIWQGFISLVNVALFASVVYRTLPDAQFARFSINALKGVGRFAGGAMAITLSTLLLTQTDKILLSRLLTLENFAHYTLAGVVANALYMLVAPIGSAFYPRFTELATRGDDLALRKVYHQGAQMVTVLMGSAAVVLMLFGGKVLRLWTADPALAQQVSPLLAVLALGTLCNGLMWIPYQMQLAHGWTSLTIKINSIAVATLVPCILWAVAKYGAIGAAWVWVALNTGYLVFGIYFFHKNLLSTEKWHWYGQDVASPLLAATATAGLCRWVMPDNLGKFGEFTVLLMSSGCVLISASLGAPLIRHQLIRFVSSRLKLVTYGYKVE